MISHKSVLPQAVLRPFMPELDTLRGLAVLGVLVVHGFAHSYPEAYPGLFGIFMRASVTGRFGVNLFFVLSGFLITGILLGSKTRTDYYRRFYFRRVLRILPPYFATIAVVLVAGGTWKFAALSSIFLANLTPLFGVASDYAPLWSLAVEEHFYLLWPTVVRHLAVKIVAICSVILIVGVPLVRYFTFGANVPFGATWYNCDGLALGALVQICVRAWPDRRRLTLAGIACAIVSISGLAVITASGQIQQTKLLGFTFQYPLVNLFMAAVLLGTLLLGTGRLKKMATPRPLTFIGYISYGLYLYHLMIFTAFDFLLARYLSSLQAGAGSPKRILVRFAISASVSILVAYASRRWYEERFLRLKDGKRSASITELLEPMAVTVER